MFQKFHALMQKRDGRGFTLIELLVVILIIAILAAIAIPVFLKQREKGWTAQSESALKNAATAVESYAAGNNGSYTGAGNADTGYTSQGYSAVDGVTITVTTPTASTYCIKAVHAQGVPTMEYKSSVGKPVVGSCT